MNRIIVNDIANDTLVASKCEKYTTFKTLIVQQLVLVNMSQHDTSSTTPVMVVSVTCYSELHIAMTSYY